MRRSRPFAPVVNRDGLAPCAEGLRVVLSTAQRASRHRPGASGLEVGTRYRAWTSGKVEYTAEWVSPGAPPGWRSLGP